MDRIPTVRELMVAAARARGAKGITAQELFAYVLARRDALACDTALSRATAVGALHKLGSSFEARYYPNRQSLDEGRPAWEAWVAARRAKIVAARKAKHSAQAKSRRIARDAARPPKKVKPASTKAAQVRAPWTVSTPATIPAWAKITIAPSRPDPIRTNTYAGTW